MHTRENGHVVKATETVREVAVLWSKCSAIPPDCAPGAPTWKTNAPATGCVSADTTRQVTVYVPSASRGSSPTETTFASGRSIDRC